MNSIWLQIHESYYATCYDFNICSRNPFGLDFKVLLLVLRGWKCILIVLFQVGVMRKFLHWINLLELGPYDGILVALSGQKGETERQRERSHTYTVRQSYSLSLAL